MIEKQKTCITIAQVVADFRNFKEYINIPHRVDIIRCTSLGGEIYSLVPALVDEAFYITSDLINNNHHDNILGVFGNLGYSFPQSVKEFRNPSGSVNGTFSFEIYSLLTKTLNIYNGGTSIFINLEFIELDRNDAIVTNMKDGRIAVK